jgi:AP-2 complex subunit alpha
VKKKAALTLLRLYRKYPAIVQHEWAERIISIMDDPDMGVKLSITSLVMALVQDNLEQYKGSYVKAAQQLKKIVVENEVSSDYLYYKVPCPWIQVKLLRLLQYYPPSGSYDSAKCSVQANCVFRGYARSADHQRIPSANHAFCYRTTKECSAK